MKEMVTTASDSQTTSTPLADFTTTTSTSTATTNHHDDDYHPGSPSTMAKTTLYGKRWWCCRCRASSQCCQHYARPFHDHNDHSLPNFHVDRIADTTTTNSKSSEVRTRTPLTIITILLLFGLVATIDFCLNHYMKKMAQTISYSSSSSIDSTSPLNDKTLQWDDEQFPHVWLAYEKQQQEIQLHETTTSSETNIIHTMIPKPPYMILLTEYGWNHPNQKHGLTYARCIRSTEYLQSIVNHKYFHPTAYHEIMITQNRTVDPNMTYYVFLDIETCYETNYPHYRKSYSGNCDRTGHRKYYTYTYIKYRHPPTAACYNFHHPDCHHISTEITTNPIFITSASVYTPNHRVAAASHGSKLVVLDCRGNGQNVLFRNSPVGNSTSLALVSLSSTAQQLNLDIDQGLAPPSVVKVPSSSSISQFDREIKWNCSSLLPTDLTSTSNDDPVKGRKYLLSFSGDYKRDPIRQEMAKLDTVRSNMSARNISATTTTPMTSDEQVQPLVLITESKDLYQNTNGLSYTELLLSSQYGAVPRGDNLFSYRFSEVLSSGAIPVLIHNSAWILPFRPEIVQWDQCVIRITADQMNTTIAILQNISVYEQCQRRQYCYHVYETYMMNTSATIQGILDGLQAISK